MPTITGFTSGVLADVYHQLLACRGKVLIYYFVVQSFTCVWHFATQWTAASQASLSFTVSWSLLKSCPLSQWYYLPILFSAVTFCFAFYLSQHQNLPVSQLFLSGEQSIGASASATILWMNSQDWYPLGSTGLISLQSRELSRVFSSTTVQKSQFFGTQPSLWSSSHVQICNWENRTFSYTVLCWQSDVSAF